jgi:hypothetical protein
MKNFVKKIILFALFIIVLATLFQAVISLRISGKTIYGIDNLEQASNINADLIFLGSSRCSAQFDPRFFDSAYHLKSVNLGVDGHSEISMIILRLKDYLSRNKPPQYAIMNFDPFMGAGSLTDNTNFVHKNVFARYAFLPKDKDLPIVDYFKFNFFERYIPLYAVFKYKLLSDCLFLPNANKARARCYGYDEHDEQWDTVANPVVSVEKDHFFKPSQISSIADALDSLHHLCLINNIKLLCIQPPVYKNCQDDFAFSATKKICGSEGIPFIDANDESIRNDITNFYNSNHLNKYGVAKMDSLLEKDTLLASFLRK